MKLGRRISRVVQTCLSLWSPSGHYSEGIFVHLNRLNFIRIHMSKPGGSLPLGGSFMWLIGSVLSQVPSTLLWEEYK